MRASKRRGFRGVRTMRIDPLRFIRAYVRIAFRLAREEEETGRRPVIEQIDVVRSEDGSDVLLNLYDENGRDYIVVVPLSEKEAANFKMREWKAALNPWVSEEARDG